MTPDLLRSLLVRGEVTFPAAPAPPAPDAAVLAVLEPAYADYRLDVAGPPVPFDADAALAAAKFVLSACWFLVNREEPAEGVARRLAFRATPTTPAQHLSADLTLRYAPTLLRRARLRDPGDPLVAALTGVLRRWPLSGVLADLRELPEGGLEFGGHPGLQLLYAERLFAHGPAAWLPAGGAAREAVELVYGQHGRALPVPPAAEGGDGD